MRRSFVTLDVFTHTHFAGNPLAVVFESAGLETAAMQAIAREFGHPETVFVLPAGNPAHRARLRIFTPASELPFAGHPTVGAAVALARRDGGGQRQSLVLEEAIGPVPCVVQPRDGDSGWAEFTLPRLPEAAGAAPDMAAMAAALSLESGDIAAAPYAPSRWTAGIAFTVVPVGNLAAMSRLRVNPAIFETVFGIGGPGMVYAICAETAEAGHHLHARMFAPGRGIAEDPASGSAVAAFAGMHVAQTRLGDGVHRLTVEQGYEMGRPSLITLTLTIERGKLASATIGGEAVVVTEGVIEA